MVYKRHLQGGLTLIELLVAISVLAFVAVLGWRGLDSIVRTRMALNTDLAQTRGMQLAFAQMQTDAAHIASSSQLPGRTPVVIDRDRLMLVRTVLSENQPLRLQLVTYRLSNGDLIRQESTATRDLNELGQMWQAASTDTLATNTVVLQRDVSTMTMRLWDGSGWRTDNAASTAPQPVTLPDGRTSRGEVERRATGISPGPAPATGLEVSLLPQDRSTPMVKIFLLGAV